jgi:DNA-binding SARP family transcriptional activator/predicted ATPase
MTTLHIRLFGGLILQRDQQTLPAPTPQKAALLLAYLLTAYNRTHPRTLLAGLFWGDQDERRARRNLSDALWRIRTLLEPDRDSAAPVLLFEGDTVRFNPAASVTHDVRAFEELLRDPPDIARLARAADLYRGDLLVGYYDDGVLLERERLRQMYLACLNRLVSAYKTQGAWEEAVAAAGRLVQADPYQEDATRDLMRLYYRLGRRDRALQQFATLKATLANDLELEPEPETVALYQMMQAGMAAGMLDAAPPPDPVPPPRSGPTRPATTSALSLLGNTTRSLHVVGREREQTELAAWLSSPRPHPPMLLLLGEAGVGKTRLAQDTAEEAYRHRMFVLWGHYYPLAAPLPYAGLVEALRVGLRLGGVPALDPLWLSEVSRLIPELVDQHPGLPRPVSLPPDQERIRLWEAFTQYLLALAAAGPHMFVLEDVQWVDPATLDLLQYALPRLRNTGVGLRLLATARSEELANVPLVEAALRNLEAQNMLGYLPVDRLSPDAITALVQEALGLDNPAPRFSSHLWRETEGNPFFALETIRFWAERGALNRDQAGAWHTNSTDYTVLPTPASVRRVLEQRLARLTPAARSVLEVGAVLGREVPETLLWRASGSTPEAVLGPAEELLRHQLWVEDVEGRGYAFAHQKVREVAYAGISGPRRRHLHRLAAGALEAEHPAAVDRLADHWLAAEDPVRALPYLQEAAERAVAAFANDAALAFYDQGVAATERLPANMGAEEIERVYALVAGRAAINKRLERMEAATADLDRLVTIARGSKQPGRVADALARRSAHFISQARYTEARADLGEALALAEAGQNTAAVARILTQATRVQIRLGNHREAIAQAERALVCYRELGDLRGEVEILSLLGPTYGETGELDRAVALLEEGLAKVRQVPQAIHLEARLLNNLGLCVSAPATSYELFTRFLALADETGSLPLQETAHQNLAELLARFGRYAEAQGHLDQALALARTAGSRHDIAMLLGTRGQIQAVLGDPGAARADLEEAVRTLEDLGARFSIMQALLWLADHLLDQGSFDLGLAIVERSHALWRSLGRPAGGQFAPIFPAQMARAHLGLRRAGAARRAAQDALAALDAGPPPDRLTWAEPAVEVLAHCYTVLAASGPSPDADAVLERGYTRMMVTADQCGDFLRPSYLEGVRECRVLRAAWEARAVAPDSLPAATGGPGAAAPEVERKVAGRRAELLIMLHDAAERGAALDDVVLARSFGVSLRTIQRDLAALRRSGRLA